MKLLIRFLLLISLSLVSEQSIFAYSQQEHVFQYPERTDDVRAVSLKANADGVFKEAVRNPKAATRKNCRKLLIVDDEEDETVSLKKSKTGKTTLSARPGRNIAAAIYGSSSHHLNFLSAHRQLPEQDIPVPARYSLHILFRVFRI